MQHLIVKRTDAEAQVPDTDTSGGLRFVLSTDTPDLMGDIVVQSGLEIPDRLPAQIDHAGSMWSAIGKWIDVERDAHRTLATLQLLPEGVSKAADLVRGIAKAGLRLGASIGFQPVEWEPVELRKDDWWDPLRYLKARLLEASIVMVPANQEALALAKRLGAPRVLLAGLEPDGAARARERAAAALARANRALLPARPKP
jgi:Caudovirus prohead serine protease